MKLLNWSLYIVTSTHPVTKEVRSACAATRCSLEGKDVDGWLQLPWFWWSPLSRSWSSGTYRFVKHCSFLKLNNFVRFFVTCSIFCHLFNLSLQQSIVPTQWKSSIITPVPKVNPPLTCSDYRPISVTPILARLMEKQLSRITCILPSHILTTVTCFWISLPFIPQVLQQLPSSISFRH